LGGENVDEGRFQLVAMIALNTAKSSILASHNITASVTISPTTIGPVRPRQAARKFEILKTGPEKFGAKSTKFDWTPGKLAARIPR